MRRRNANIRYIRNSSYRRRRPVYYGERLPEATYDISEETPAVNNSESNDQRSVAANGCDSNDLGTVGIKSVNCSECPYKANAVRNAGKPKSQQSTYSQKSPKSFFEKLLNDDMLVIALIAFLLLKHSADRDDEDCNNNNNSDGLFSGFSLDKIKRQLKLDKLSQNDVLVALLVYLMV